MPDHHQRSKRVAKPITGLVAYKRYLEDVTDRQTRIDELETELKRLGEQVVALSVANENCAEVQTSLSNLVQTLAHERDSALNMIQELNTNQTQLASLVQTLADDRQLLLEQKQQISQAQVQLFNNMVNDYEKHSFAVWLEMRDNPLAFSNSSLERVKQVESLLASYDTPLNTLAVLDLMPETHDSVYSSVLRTLYMQRMSSETTQFWDIRIALNVLARVLRPKTYLEVGTRLGWSMAQVLCHAPSVQAYSFDLWVENYASLDNPGMEFVQAQLRRVVPADIALPLTFVPGNSHNTLVEFFEPQRYSPSFKLNAPPPQTFDLITVDGDHSIEGAWMDLAILFPHVNIGGAIVFDDLELSLYNSDIVKETTSRYRSYYPPFPGGIESLGRVWDEMKLRYPNFAFIETERHQNSTGVAIRLS